jgi:hypothetical protein
MFETELLDRTLMSLTKTEEAFVDVNNKVIDAINQRKDRLNNINTRIQNLSQKIIALYSVENGMRIVSGA